MTQVMRRENLQQDRLCDDIVTAFALMNGSVDMLKTSHHAATYPRNPGIRLRAQHAQSRQSRKRLTFCPGDT